jgi:hypothetical protein
MMATG